jgi:hypothetical protein
MMRGASLRSVAELLGHASMKMTIRYANLSPAFCPPRSACLILYRPLLSLPQRARNQKGQEKGNVPEGRSASIRSAWFCSGNWLLGLDSNQQPSG